jgi:hypothetical protein
MVVYLTLSIRTVLLTGMLCPVASAREQTIPTEGPLHVGEVSANFLRIEGCRVVSATDPYGDILGSLDQTYRNVIHKIRYRSLRPCSRFSRPDLQECN